MAAHKPRAEALRRRRELAAASATAVLLATVAITDALGGGGSEASFTESAEDTDTEGSLSQPYDPFGPDRGALGMGGWVAASFARPQEERLQPAPAAREVQPPKHSGHGKRVVYDISAQRVWLVSARNDVERAYAVSGGLTSVVEPGSYEVYSKSRHAIGVDNSGTMEYMVRFAYGSTAAIGFHDIPVLNGELVQTRAQLGTPQSHGCIRQRHTDARALWQFSPVGTTVVVLA